MLTRIEHIQSTLSPAERRVADWILEHPFGLDNLRLATLAAAAGVSEPTVVRFCRRIGCRGFSDFKLRMAGLSGNPAGAVHAEVSDGDNAQTIIHKVFDSSMRELQRVMRGLNGDAMASAAQRIVVARRVMFMGTGASAIVANDAENKFFRLGLACAAFTDTPSMLQAAATADSDTVVVAISKSGRAGAVTDAAALARRQGATLVAMTSSGSPLAASAGLCLLIDASEDTTTFTPMSSRLAQLAVLDALQVCSAIAGGETTQRHLDASKSALLGLAV